MSLFASEIGYTRYAASPDIPPVPFEDADDGEEIGGGRPGAPDAVRRDDATTKLDAGVGFEPTTYGL